jgi:hypothetical protein
MCFFKHRYRNRYHYRYRNRYHYRYRNHPPLDTVLLQRATTCYNVLQRATVHKSNQTKNKKIIYNTNIQDPK